jgi:integrase
MDEAFAWRGAKQAAAREEDPIRAHGDPDSGDYHEETQEGLVDDLIGDRVEDIRREHGDAAAGAFGSIAAGVATPALHYLSDWLREGGARGPYQPRTKRQLEGDLKELEEWMRGAKLAPTLEAIDRRAAGRYVTEHLTRAGLDAKTVQRKVSACRSYWVWLGRKGHVPDDRNPWDRQAPPKAAASGHDEDNKRPFTDAEVVALLNGPADAEIADLMPLAALSGMRIEEINRLQVRHCAGGVFNITESKTDAGVRKVPIHPDLSAIVARRVNDKVPTAYLFPEPGPLADGRERSMAASKRFGRYRKRDGVGVDEQVEGKRRGLVNFHSFRRWFITAAIRLGQPEHVVQQVVGHALQGVTMGVYFGKDDAARLRECVEAVRLPAEGR